MKKEEVDHQISTTRLLASVEEGEISTTRMFAEDFNVDNSTIVRRLKKLRKVWKLAVWIPHELSDNNKTEHVWIYTDLLRRETSKLRFWRISSLAMNRDFSSRTSKERRFEFRQVFHPKDYRKASIYLLFILATKEGATSYSI